MTRIKLGLVLCILIFTQLSRSEISVSLDAQALSFISPDYENTELKNFGFMGATLRSDAKVKDFFMLNLTGLYAVGHPTLSYLNFREIYFNYQINEISDLAIGRKLTNWSALDELWNIGFFQPQFRWNTLNPESQGLTGLFWDHRENFWSMGLFASPLFIPDQGPGYELKDGQFENSSPWFPKPPQNVRFQGNVILPIDYQIMRPETSDVIFQTIYGAQFHLGEKTGFFANIAGLYKPSNQLALGYKVVEVVTRVRVDLAPKVYYEYDFSADLGYRSDWGLMGFSVLYSRPQDPTFGANYNAPHFEPSLSYGPTLKLNLNPFALTFSYLDTSGGNVTETGPFASDDRAALSQRFLFRQAYQIEAGYSEIFFKKVKWVSSFQYRESAKDEFKQIRFRNKLDFKGPWAFWGDLILIETADDSLSNVGPQRNLDQVMIGASYDI